MVGLGDNVHHCSLHRRWCCHFYCFGHQSHQTPVAVAVPPLRVLILGVVATTFAAAMKLGATIDVNIPVSCYYFETNAAIIVTILRSSVQPRPLEPLLPL